MTDAPPAVVPSERALVPMNVATMTDDELGRTIRIATDLAKSQLFPDAKTAHAAFAKILLGRDLGLSPTQALTGIYIVEGKPQIAAVTLAAFIRKTPGLGYKVTEHTADTCSIEFYADGELRGVSTFTIAEAKTAGLVRDKSGWAKYPRNMLFARAMSNGAKWYVPEVLGGIPVYTEGDTFEGTATEVAGAIGTGSGDGSAPGWGDTDPQSAAAVEAVVARAKNVGHTSLSDLASIQVSLAGQSDEVIRQWCVAQSHELDEYEQRRLSPKGSVEEDESDAVAENAPGPSEDEAALRARHNGLLDQIIAEKEEPEPDEAMLAELREEADDIERRLKPNDGQEEMAL